MIIGTIVNGVVIDHIPAGRGMELYSKMKLDRLECEVALIKNAPSGKCGKKDILKVNEEIKINYEILGYIDPRITVNIIKDGQRVKKLHPALPETLIDVIFCRNPRCITSVEQEISHVFRLTDRENGIYRCVYCDAQAEKNDIMSERMLNFDGTGHFRSVVQFDGRLWNILLHEKIRSYKISDCLPGSLPPAESRESFFVTG